MMTPCEKLGYKVGDKFEVVKPYEGWGFCCLDRIKPLTVTTLNKSKTWLATALIEAGVTQFPEGANWAAQDCDGWREGHPLMFYAEKPYYNKGSRMWNNDAPSSTVIGDGTYIATLNPQWHQTVLSRDEFDQFVASRPVVPSEPEQAEPEYCESVTRSIPEPVVTPTLDHLLQDWRNADDFAQRKQTEADEAAAMRDERWQAVQARAGGMGVTVGKLVHVVSEPEPAKPVLTGKFHNTKLCSPEHYIPGEHWGDEICDEYGKRFGEHRDVRCPR